MADKARENRLRREAKRRGLQLCKCGRKWRDCTFASAYVAEVGKALEGWGTALEGWDPVTLTAAEATDLSERTKLARDGGSVLEVVMPNGKKWRDCTFAYVAEVGKALEGWGIALEGWEPVTLTAAEATDLSERTKLARDGGSVLEVVMPNGKKWRDCTFAYIAEVGKALEGWGIALEGWDT